MSDYLDLGFFGTRSRRKWRITCTPGPTWFYRAEFATRRLATTFMIGWALCTKGMCTISDVMSNLLLYICDWVSLALNVCFFGTHPTSSIMRFENYSERYMHIKGGSKMMCILHLMYIAFIRRRLSLIQCTLWNNCCVQAKWVSNFDVMIASRRDHDIEVGSILCRANCFRWYWVTHSHPIERKIATNGG